MIDAVNVAVQEVLPNSPVLFGATRIKTGCSVRHEQGSGRFILLKPGIYRVSYNSSLAALAGTANLNVTQDGEAIAGAKILLTTVAATQYSVSVTTLLRVFCCDSAVSMTNVGLLTLNISNANMVIDRLC